MAACAGGDTRTSRQDKPYVVLTAESIPARSDITMPQLVLGPDRARNFTEVAFSLHCDGSRSWFMQRFPSLVRDCNAGRRQMMLSHVARTDAELLAGAEVLSVGSAHYGNAMMAVLAYSLADSRALSATEIRAFLSAIGMERAQGGAETRRIAMITMRALYESLGATATPFVLESVKT